MWWQCLQRLCPWQPEASSSYFESNYSRAVSATAGRSLYKNSMSHNDHVAAKLEAALAEELRDVRGLLEGIADTLSSDEQLVMAYTQQLQGFDLAIQRAEESAALLDRMASGSPLLEAIEGVGLSHVRDRLLAAVKAA